MNRIRRALAFIQGHLLAVGLALLAWSLGASFAAAQSVPMPTPADTSSMFGTEYGDAFSSIYLNQLFGELFPPAFGASHTTVFSAIIGYFNVIMLVVGGMIFFWNVTVGVLQSAHEGKMLGQRWSSLWAPVRIIFAVGLMVPVPGLGGYNLAQNGVAYVVRGSTNIASSVWSTAATLIITNKVTLTSAPARIDPSAVKTMYENVSCAIITNYRYASAAGTDTASKKEVVFNDYRAPAGILSNLGLRAEPTNYTKTRMSYLQDAGGGLSQEGICGSYTTPDVPIYLQKAIAAAGDDFSLADGSNSAALVNAFADAHIGAMDKLYSTLATKLNDAGFSQAILNKSAPLPRVTDQVVAAMTDASDVLATGMENVMQIASGSSGAVSNSGAAISVPLTGELVRKRLLERITGNCSGGTGDDSTPATCYGEGWIGAGSWYMIMARLNNELASLLEARSTVTGPDELGTAYVIPGWFGGVSDTARTEKDELTARVDKAFADSTAGLAALGFSMGVDNLKDLNAATDSDSILNKAGPVGSRVYKAATFWIDQTSPSNFGSDPMIGLAAVGRIMISLVSVLFGVALLAGSSLTILGTGVTLPTGLATVLVPLAMVLLGAGGTLAFVLPMAPFIIWILAVTGYFLLIFEAVVAVNLWALGHLRMDGEGVSGEAGRKGWLMMLALLMTPVLMVFGFIVGMTIFRVSSSLMDAGIHQALSGILSQSIILNVSAMAIYTVTTAVVYIILLERSFSLVSEFPARVLRWIDSSVDLGDHGDKAKWAVAAGAGTAAKAGQIGLQAAHVGGRGIQKSAQKLLPQGAEKGQQGKQSSDPG